MLGILLAILKFILLLLLGILLLALFLVAVVLLSPIGYRLDGEWKETAKGTFFVKWLFGILRVKGRFSQNEEMELTVKLLWFSLLGEKKKKKKKRRKPVPQKIAGETVLTVRERPPKPPETVKETQPVAETIPLPEAIAPKETADTTQIDPIPKEAQPKVRRVKLSEIAEKPFDADNSIFDSTQEASEEDTAFFTGAKQESSTLESIKKAWRQFQEIEGKREIMQALKKLIKRLIRGIAPKDFTISGTVGLGEPELTGYFMGLMGILTAKFGSHIQVKADFTRLVAEDLELHIKGRIIIGSFLYALLAFILTKPVRRIAIKLWKGRSKNG